MTFWDANDVITTVTVTACPTILVYFVKQNTENISINTKYSFIKRIPLKTCSLYKSITSILITTRQNVRGVLIAVKILYFHVMHVTL